MSDAHVNTDRPFRTGSLPDQVDAVVCGGGPAGSTFAALLSRKGHRVVLFSAWGSSTRCGAPGCR